MYINKPLNKDSVINIITKSKSILYTQQQLFSKYPYAKSHVFQNIFEVINIYFKPYKTNILCDTQGKYYIDEFFAPGMNKRYYLSDKEIMKAFPYMDEDNEVKYNRILYNIAWKKKSYETWIKPFFPINYSPCKKYIKLRFRAINMKKNCEYDEFIWIKTEKMKKDIFNHLIFTSL